MCRPCQCREWRRSASACAPSVQHRVVAVAVEELRFGTFRTALPGPCTVDGAAVRRQHDAVILLRALAADEAAPHVSKNPLRLAVERVAEAPASTGLDAHDIAALDDVAVAQRLEDAFA